MRLVTALAALSSPELLSKRELMLSKGPAAGKTRVAVAARRCALWALAAGLLLLVVSWRGRDLLRLAETTTPGSGQPDDADAALDPVDDAIERQRAECALLGMRPPEEDSALDSTLGEPESDDEAEAGPPSSASQLEGAEAAAEDGQADLGDGATREAAAEEDESAEAAAEEEDESSAAAAGLDAVEQRLARSVSGSAGRRSRRSSSSVSSSSSSSSSLPSSSDLKQCLSQSAGSLASQGRFVGREWRFEGPCARAGVSRWFSSPVQVCDALQRVELHVIGQSTERRLVHALQDMVLGRRGAFRSDLSAPPASDHAQRLFDAKNFVPNAERGDESVSRELNRCLSVRYYKAEFEAGVLETARSVVKAAELAPRGGRRVVVLFQFGLYALASGTLRQQSTLWAAARLDRWLKSGVAAEADRKGVVLMWRAPAAVNEYHPRFSTYREPWMANAVLRKFHNATKLVAQANGICSLDVFLQTLTGSRLEAMLEFEAGTEWRPPQPTGPIHLTDSGRILVANLFLSSLDVCQQRAALPLRHRSRPAPLARPASQLAHPLRASLRMRELYKKGNPNKVFSIKHLNTRKQ
jgi:hypothetical protein